MYACELPPCVYKLRQALILVFYVLIVHQDIPFRSAHKHDGFARSEEEPELDACMSIADTNKDQASCDGCMAVQPWDQPTKIKASHSNHRLSLLPIKLPNVLKWYVV
ncbi:hypothetical protein M431DRAFT_480043 [Trichoderma harzianum CBS 226.95]|uniref:Uncharacterized protein n=1 Tax=Trichoderma harzianum CBS 226.95 TaxID=983964 RepID=A0A2T4AGZ0_TRIHA|nr:hypothetical protein M431DRAFT_480043 [Trichoderma harzianum CBS 226.95]PTB56349.1 hypothetical protein M431DRAFT_480043 [Trichoderma harzianum CBS 226.95]